MPICENCGRDVIPVKPKFSSVGCAVVSIVSFLFLAIPYLLWHATRRADVCPACGKNVYRGGQATLPAMYCPACGQQLKQGARFCQECGAKVSR